MKFIKNQTVKKLTYLGIVLTALTLSVIMSLDAQQPNSNYILPVRDVDTVVTIKPLIVPLELDSNTSTNEIPIDDLPNTANTITTEPAKTSTTHKIQIALIMDTSGSMEGLIEQAKSQLWNLVGALSHAKYGDKTPKLEIALYQYGNDGLSSSSGYIQRISPLISDLDEVSAALFSLRTNGGSEYCGMVIEKSLHGLEWSKSDDDIKMIFIAGNEPFTQGPVNYESACGDARAKGVVVNTIHCGSYSEGVRGSWKSGAMIGGGDYMCIEQNRRTVYVQTPYDDRINECGAQLNKTYIYYGANGCKKKVAQECEDANASSYSKSNLASRNSMKVSSFYSNDSWDLVDAAVQDSSVVGNVDKKTLSPELQKKTDAELEAYVKEQAAKRAKLKKEIAELNKKRMAYIAKQNKVEGSDLQSSMVNAVRKQAKAKNYSW